MQLGGGTHEALPNDVLKLVAARGKGSSLKRFEEYIRTATGRWVE